MQLIGSIPKTRLPLKLLTKKKNNDISKETTIFMRNIGCARLCDYSLTNVLKYEITSTSFYLTKDGFLHKHKKPELANVIKELFKKCLPKVPMCNKKCNGSGRYYGLRQESASKKSQIEN